MYDQFTSCIHGDMYILFYFFIHLLIYSFLKFSIKSNFKWMMINNNNNNNNNNNKELLVGSHYKKICKVYAVFSLALKYLEVDVFRQHVVKKNGSFVFKHRQAGEAITKVCIFICKLFTNSFFGILKATQPLQKWRRVIAK